MIVGLGIGVTASSHFVVSAAAEVIRRKVGVTAVGNAQVDTAQSKFGGASALFDGSGDYLNIKASPVFKFDSSDFTIEFWFRPTANTNVPMEQRDGGLASGSREWYFYHTPAGVMQFGISSSTSLPDAIIGTTTITNSTWNHVAAVKNGTNVELFLNGVSEGSETCAGLTGSDTIDIRIGALDESLYLNGHMDEIRISNTARYTTGFTPSTTPFVNDENTLLLLHMDGTDAATVFEDDNGMPPFANRTAKTITAVGNAQVDTAQSKFGGASALFDGSGDYLEIPYSNDFDYGTGDFTVEGWVRYAGLSGDSFIVSGFGESPTFSGWFFGIRNGTDIGYGRAGVAWDYNVAHGMSTGTWYHVVWCRSGTSIRLFVNGTQVGSTQTSSQSYTLNNDDLFVGSQKNQFYTNGHIDEVRISNTARYTANFTAPTAPFQNDSNTLLLLHMDGTDASTVFTDDNIVYRTKVGITAIGNAQVDTAQSKFGGASAVFDGSGDYLQVLGDIDLSSDFTIEFFVRFTTREVAALLLTFYIDNTYQGHIGFEANNSYGFTRVGHGVGVMRSSNGGTEYNFYNIPLETWHHLAITRSGNVFTMWLNGLAMHTVSDSATTYKTNNKILIGSYDGTSNFHNGHLDEIRISNVARYTANFTPSTTPFQNDSNTLLLIHMDGTDGSTYFEDDNGAFTPGRTARHISPVGNAQIDTAQSKFGGASALFDGTDDYLQCVYNTNFTGDFTIECWARFNSIASDQTVWQFGNSNTDALQIYLYTVAGADQYKMRLDVWGRVGAFSSITVTTNTWYHFATVRSGSTITLYIDGINRASLTRSQTIGNDGDLYLGARQGSTFDFNGHIDELRVSNIARYTADFTPQTTAFTDDANTLLLLHMDGTDASTTFVDDVGGRAKVGITAIGNAQIDTAQSKFGGASYLGDGSGDRLKIIGEVLDGEYTVEYWLRGASFSNFPTLVDFRGGAGGQENYSDFITSAGIFSVFTNSGTRIQSSTTLSTGVWYHIAVVRDSSSDIKLYVNGTKEGATYNWSGFDNNTVWYIGDNYLFGSSFNGHIDELRVSNTARYTANFTAPTAPFVNDANTLLLIHADGTDGSTIFTDDNGVPPDYDYGA